ncbi:MAG TPA: FG-GAP-like repeat-containing protein, partial [Chthoniobacteraceae bacterium]|nr:FG-GAP-like repeat-containing protein [Chthoniobacteraceae bacterium]
MKIFSLVLGAFSLVAVAWSDGAGNRLAHLTSDDPFYPGLGQARLTTPQWIGEEGVETVVVISIDDLKETKKYEDYLRPVLERLKRIENGRAPATIFCNQLTPSDPQFQTWLKEGVSLDVHTLTHPCPLLGKAGDFAAAEQTVHGGIDLLAKVPGNRPVAYRMPCCDSMNSLSPRFFAEIFARPTGEGRFLSIDSSVMCLLTSKDASVPRELVLDADGNERFRKYFPMELVPPRKLTFERFAGYIADYPYPYVIGRGCWELPCVVPSDWEAFNTHGSKNPRTTEDWKAALDAIVVKQGVMTMVLHPHGWSDPQQIVDLIDHAEKKHGRKVRFLNMREVLERLEKHALAGNSLRSEDGGDNGVRLLDVNADGYMDVVIGNEKTSVTRVWDPKGTQWTEDKTPAAMTLQAKAGGRSDMHVQLGVLRTDGAATMLVKGHMTGAWTFYRGAWKETPELLNGLEEISTGKGGVDGGVRLRDFDGDGICELLVSNPKQNAVYRWSASNGRWESAGYALPPGVTLVDELGRDNGLRFVDLNADGFDDVFFSNAQRYDIHLWAKTTRPDLGWTPGWSHGVKFGERKGSPNEPPPIVRDGPHRNNGAWFK